MLGSVKPFSSRHYRFQRKVRDSLFELQVKGTNVCRTVYLAVVGVYECKNRTHPSPDYDCKDSNVAWLSGSGCMVLAAHLSVGGI